MAMLTLEECQKTINRHLNEINLPELPSNLYKPVRYMLDLGAKRLRPAMVLMGCNVFSDNVDMALNPAMAIEIFHNFTLVHDDIMDRSDLRRNQPTVHVKWSPNIAILSGDAMVIKAYELLSNTPAALLHQILPVFNATALKVCEGQQYDMDYESITAITLTDYLQMVEYKTAVLIAAALKIGGLCGCCNEAESELLYQFGKNIGIAFQLQDDLLDVFADSAVFGKVTGNDIVSNKKTILLVEALQLAEGTGRKKLLEWIRREQFDRNEKISAIRSIYTSLNLEDRVKQRIEQLHESAIGFINKLPVQGDRKTELLKFSQFLLNRQK